MSNQMNYKIRRSIENYIKMKGAQETRHVIALFAKQFKTTKQRISGNLSYMACHEQCIHIFSDRPHSVVY